MFVKNGHVWEKGVSLSNKEKAPAARLFSRKQGLGARTPMTKTFVVIIIDYYALLVLLLITKHINCLLIASWLPRLDLVE